MFLWFPCQRVLLWLGLRADAPLACLGGEFRVSAQLGEPSPALCCAPIPAARGQIHLHCSSINSYLLISIASKLCLPSEWPKLFNCTKDQIYLRGFPQWRSGVMTRNGFDFVLPSHFLSLLLPLFRIQRARLCAAAVDWSEEHVQVLQAGARCEHPSSGNKCSNFAVVLGTTSSEWLGVVALMISSDTVSRLTNWLSSERSLKRIADKSIWIYN